MRAATLALIAALVLAATALAPLGCGRPADRPAEPARVVGDDACRPCHTREFERFKRTRHARTLRPATESGLGADAPKPGKIDGTTCLVRRDGDGFVLRNEASGKEVRFALAMGSGKLAMTFVGYDGAGGLAEARMSWFPRLGRWYITPGQEIEDPDQASFPHVGAAGKRCLSCHSVASEPDLTVAPSMRGVGCESCHGPGSAHVEAAQRKDKDLKIERMASWGATRLNDACGVCHRAPSMVSNHGLEMAMTNRFQSYGLSLSPCFQKSGDTFSCITCHEAHGDSGSDPKEYEAVCLSCHAPDAGKPCPVNPKAACIGCHMPSRPVFPKSEAPVRMAEHLILKYGKR